MGGREIVSFNFLLLVGEAICGCVGFCSHVSPVVQRMNTTFMYTASKCFMLYKIIKSDTIYAFMMFL